MDVNTINPVDDGQYIFETKSKVDGGATNSYISAVTVESDSTYYGAYSIEILPTADAEEYDGTSTFTINLKDATNTPVAGASVVNFPVSKDSGVQTLKLGDLEVEVDLDALWNATDHNSTLSASETTFMSPLAINISKEIVATNGTETFSVGINASDLNKQKTFNIGNGKISLTIDGNALTPGNPITANVSFENYWKITDYEGNNQVLSQTDLNTLGKLTNLQIGNPGDGVQIDSDK